MIHLLSQRKAHAVSWDLISGEMGYVRLATPHNRERGVANGEPSDLQNWRPLCGFLSAACILPDYKREDVRVFSADAIMRYEKVIRSTAHLILRFSR